MKPLFSFLLAVFPAFTANANDGIGGLSATGLTFGQTDAVQMGEEDLFISKTAIRVSYLFRNISDRDVTGEVIFPLPPIALTNLMFSDMNLPADTGRENLVAFTAVADGQPVKVSTDGVAVINTVSAENNPARQYDTPGREVTGELASYGIPLILNA
jgi:hypothetical protein